MGGYYGTWPGLTKTSDADLLVTTDYRDVLNEVSKAYGDNTISDNDLHKCRKEWLELVAAGQQLMDRMERDHDASVPAHLRAAP